MVSALSVPFNITLALASEVQKIAWHPASSHSSCWEDLWAIIAGSSIPWVIRFWELYTEFLPLRCTPLSWTTLRFWPLSYNYTKSGIQWFLKLKFILFISLSNYELQVFYKHLEFAKFSGEKSELAVCALCPSVCCGEKLIKGGQLWVVKRREKSTKWESIKTQEMAREGGSCWKIHVTSESCFLAFERSLPKSCQSVFRKINVIFDSRP